MAVSEGLMPARSIGDVEGTVISIDTYQEEADRNWLKTLNNTLLFAEFFMLPLAALLLAFQANPLLAVVIAIIFFLLVRLLFRGGLVILMGLVHFLGFQRSRTELVPVQFYRITTTAGEEATVRRKGILARGNVMVGDRVSFWGRWRGGVLLFDRGVNHRVGAQLRHRSNPYQMALAVHILLLCLVLFGGLASIIN